MRPLLILLGILALPIAEIWLVVFLVGEFGWGPVLVAGAVFFGLGLAMVGRASRAWAIAIQRAQTDPGFVNTGFGAAVGSSALLLIGGTLLIIPGFITGLIGLFFVFPPTRGLVRRVIGTRVDAAATARGQQRITIIEGETVVRTEQPPSGPSTPGSGSGGPVVISGEIVGPEKGPQTPSDSTGPGGRTPPEPD